MGGAARLLPSPSIALFGIIGFLIRAASWGAASLSEIAPRSTPNETITRRRGALQSGLPPPWRGFWSVCSRNANHRQRLLDQALEGRQEPRPGGAVENAVVGREG